MKVCPWCGDVAAWCPDWPWPDEPCDGPEDDRADNDDAPWAPEWRMP